MTLTGLPDTKKDQPCDVFTTVAQARVIIRVGKAATTASDNGAINIWKDDAGLYRGERHRFMIRQSGGKFTSLRALWNWLRIELPKIQ